MNFPGRADQFSNGAMLEELGVGYSLPLRDLATEPTDATEATAATAALTSAMASMLVPPSDPVSTCCGVDAAKYCRNQYLLASRADLRRLSPCSPFLILFFQVDATKTSKRVSPAKKKNNIDPTNAPQF